MFFTFLPTKLPTTVDTFSFSPQIGWYDFCIPSRILWKSGRIADRSADLRTTPHWAAEYFGHAATVPPPAVWSLHTDRPRGQVHTVVCTDACARTQLALPFAHTPLVTLATSVRKSVIGRWRLTNLTPVFCTPNLVCVRSEFWSSVMLGSAGSHSSTALHKAAISLCEKFAWPCTAPMPPPTNQNERSAVAAALKRTSIRENSEAQAERDLELVCR